MTARAREFYQRALELQQGTGFSSYLYYQIASTYLAEGRLDEARAGIDRMLRSAEPKRDAVRGAGVLTALSGDLTTARSYFEQSVPEYTEPYDVMLYAWILQQSGEGERVRSMLQGLTRHLIARSGGQPALPWNFVDMARIRVVEGNREEALRYLEAAVRQGWRFPNDRPGDPILGSLRGDPRYDRLVAEMKADVDRMRARVEREGW
jgi:protein kinase/serine/threonine-protein kinase